MDVAAAWIKVGEGAKTARRVSATGTVNVLDALTPVCAPFAARWDAEADRRAQLRTPEHLKALMDAQRAANSARVTAQTAHSQLAVAKSATGVLSGQRRAARAAVKATGARHAEARRALAVARRDYPNTLTSVAARVHSVHVVPSVVVSAIESLAHHDVTVWPASVSAALIGLNIGALWLGRRSVTAVTDDGGMTEEERRLMGRLDPSWWAQHAEEHGLERTVTGQPQLTDGRDRVHCPAGRQGGPRSGWRPRRTRSGALLGMRTETRMQISRGSHGDRALIVIRTRSASDGLDLKGWKPGDVWAVDTVTGETVPVPLGKRILIAGTSGSGKSTSARPLLAEASERPDHRLVILDRKYVEGRTWEHRARVACELADMRTVVGELIAEGEERLQVLPRGEDTVQISADRPRITVFVDEMGELLSDCAAKYRDEDGKSADYQDVIAGLRTIARKYRAAEIILVPATQKPTLTGDGHGLDSQIAGQLTVRLALAVATSTETQSVFGPDAIEKGWKAHELPMPWVALMRDQDKGPAQRTNPIRMRWMTAQQVINLPARPVWHRSGTAVPVPDPDTGGRRLQLVKQAPAPAAESAPTAPTVPAAGVTNRDRVLDAIRDGARTARDVTDRTGLNKGTVSKAVTQLVDAGAVVRAADGT